MLVILEDYSKWICLTVWIEMEVLAQWLHISWSFTLETKQWWARHVIRMDKVQMQKQSLLDEIKTKDRSLKS